MQALYCAVRVWICWARGILCSKLCERRRSSARASQRMRILVFIKIYNRRTRRVSHSTRSDPMSIEWIPRLIENMRRICVWCAINSMYAMLQMQVIQCCCCTLLKPSHSVRNYVVHVGHIIMRFWDASRPKYILHHPQPLPPLPVCDLWFWESVISYANNAKCEHSGTWGSMEFAFDKITWYNCMRTYNLKKAIGNFPIGKFPVKTYSTVASFGKILYYTPAHRMHARM